MPRPDKVQAVEEIRDRLQSSTASFLTEYRGLSVNQLQELRVRLREAGGSYKVYKMTLARRAAEAAGAAELTQWLGGPTAIAFAGDDPAPVAKALSDFAEQHDFLVIKGGLLSGDVIAPEVVAKLATLESRNVLLAKIVGAGRAPLIKMAGMMASFTRDAASVFSQLLEKKETDAPEPEVEAEAIADDADDGADESGGTDAMGEPDAGEQQDSTDEQIADGDADGSEEE